MPRFKRLTIEEARTLSRDELMPRLEAEQEQYWMRKPAGFDPEGYKVFQTIMRAAVDPGKALSETRALLEPPHGRGVLHPAARRARRVVGRCLPQGGVDIRTDIEHQLRPAKTHR